MILFDFDVDQRVWIYLAIFYVDNPGFVENVDDKIDIKLINDHILSELKHFLQLFSNNNEFLEGFLVGNFTVPHSPDSLLRETYGRC
jgi:hypothetical protein